MGWLGVCFLAFLSLETTLATVSNGDRIRLIEADEERRVDAVSQMLSTRVTGMASSELLQFAPVTAEGQNNLMSLVKLISAIPYLSDCGIIVSENPVYVVNLLESLRGTYFLSGLYRYIGGEKEVEAHQCESTTACLTLAHTTLSTLMLLQL